MLPTTNISTTLVANTLGTSSRDVGTLCTSDRINKWSKYKPTRYSAIAPTMDLFWKANDGYCGFDISTARIDNANDTDGMLNNIWTYLLPRGGADEPYRLGDFRGYEHNALVLYTCNPPASFVINGEAIVTFTENQADGNIKFTDLLSLWNTSSGGSTNICVLIKLNNAVLYGSVNVSQGGEFALSVTLGLSFLPGSADMYVFLSDLPCSNNTFPSNTVFWCYPDSDEIPRHFTVSVSQEHTNYDDAFEIYQWNVTTYSNYIQFTYNVRMTPSYEGTMTIMSFNRQNIRATVNVQSSYGTVVFRSNMTEGASTFRISNFSIDSSSSTATVSGYIYLDEFSIRLSYDGYIYFELQNSTSTDVLGLYEVEFI